MPRKSLSPGERVEVRLSSGTWVVGAYERPHGADGHHIVVTYNGQVIARPRDIRKSSEGA